MRLLLFIIFSLYISYSNILSSADLASNVKVSKLFYNNYMYTKAIYEIFDLKLKKNIEKIEISNLKRLKKNELEKIITNTVFFRYH